ncbi:hypothetical protein QN277_005770 [Acacia crassicarpa]|uniref:Uncharacterized protein n=1 Tax=Acacia crassicarpa TaxID=499986 RepID=A0AAE1IYP4_9FABA|nr:hypothetical protein QN277_005770 [Acacia crassicarpa]
MVDEDGGKGENVACAVKTEVVADCSGLNGAWSLREEGAEGGRRWTKRGSSGSFEGRRRSPMVWFVLSPSDSVSRQSLNPRHLLKLDGGGKGKPMLEGENRQWSAMMAERH